MEQSAPLKPEASLTHITSDLHTTYTTFTLNVVRGGEAEAEFHGFFDKRAAHHLTHVFFVVFCFLFCVVRLFVFLLLLFVFYLGGDGFGGLGGVRG